jgi:hypothetical protein
MPKISAYHNYFSAHFLFVIPFGKNKEINMRYSTLACSALALSLTACSAPYDPLSAYPKATDVSAHLIHEATRQEIINATNECIANHMRPEVQTMVVRAGNSLIEKQTGVQCWPTPATAAFAAAAEREAYEARHPKAVESPVTPKSVSAPPPSDTTSE